MFDVGKYINEFAAFLFFLVIFVWILRSKGEFNNILSGVAKTYTNTFTGLTKGSIK